MKAVRIHEFGGPEVLSYEDVEVPNRVPAQARVKLAASGVNFIDVYQRTGLYPGDLPLTLGLEGAGEVDAVGEGVEDCHPEITWPSRARPAPTRSTWSPRPRTWCPSTSRWSRRGWPPRSCSRA